MEEKKTIDTTTLKENQKAKTGTKTSTTKMLVIGGLLSAIGLLIPLIVPKIVIAPGMTVTIGSHVAVMMAMFINPWIAVCVTLTTTLGFFITTPPLVALRALSHIVFAFIGSLLAKKMLKTHVRSIILNIALSILHGLMEVLTVYLYMLAVADFISSIEQNVIFYLFILVGIVTMVHSIVDYTIAYSIYLPIKKYKLI